MNIYNELEAILAEEVVDIAENVFDNNDLTFGDLKEEGELIILIEEQIKEFLSINYEGEELTVYEDTFEEYKDIFFKNHLKFFKAILRDLIRSGE